MPDIYTISKEDEHYPASLTRYLRADAPGSIWAMGNLDILREKKTAFFCSSKCPGELIIKTYDLAKKWSDDGVAIIGGFHSPMERECLTILLRGKQPVILCPARSIEGMRVKEEQRKPLEEGRLLLLSSFPAKDRRVTTDTALMRNRFVAALCDDILVSHAAPEGKTEKFCSDILSWGKPATTLDSPLNENLIRSGWRVVR